MLFSIPASTWLQSTSTGGHLQSAGGFDHIYSSSPTCSSPLNYETELYVSSTGQLVDWIREPTLASGTVTYICYGNTAITTSQQNPTGTWNSSYQAVYHFAGTLANATDSTSNALNASGSSLTAATTLIDGGASLNGNSSYVWLASSSSTKPQLPVTVSAWVDLSSLPTSSWYNVFSSDATGSYIGYNVGITPSGALQAQFGNGGSAIASHRRTKVSSSSLTFGSWHYVVAVIQSSTNMELYIDGLDASGTYSGTGGVINYSGASSTMGFGSSTFGGQYFPGLMDEVRISNISSTPSQVYTEFQDEGSPNGFYSLGPEVFAVGGGIGIGTTNPSSTLQVFAVSSSTVEIGASSTATGCLEMGAASGTLGRLVYFWFDSGAAIYSSTTKPTFCD
jgi:hypothetical protein